MWLEDDHVLGLIEVQVGETFLHKYVKGVAGAILMDLSKAFDCLNHELLITKLEAYGFSGSALKLVHDYLGWLDEKQT